MGSPAPVPGLRGRERELRALGEALDRVASGGTAIVLVEVVLEVGVTARHQRGAHNDRQ
jgi:hypothetical protein